jgi:hypothetical protein
MKENLYRKVWLQWFRLVIKYFTHRLEVPDWNSLAEQERRDKERELRCQAVLAALSIHDLTGKYPDEATEEVKLLCEKMREEKSKGGVWAA